MTLISLIHADRILGFEILAIRNYGNFGNVQGLTADG